MFGGSFKYRGPLNSYNAGSILNCSETEFVTQQISIQTYRIELLLDHWIRCQPNDGDNKDNLTKEKLDSNSLSSDIVRLIYLLYEHRVCLYLKNGETYPLKSEKVDEYLAIIEYFSVHVSFRFRQYYPI